ncbi:MAG: hypothetical protein KAQ75_10305, partial [Bacteroidales bacterium]|nr:hypothetical protein [Bacteroidales bacterium]
IYNKGGIHSALDEIEDMNSNSSYSFSNRNIIFYSSVRYDGVNAQNMYFKALADQIKFTESELNSYMKALEEVVSNSTKGTILRDILKKYELKGYLMEQFLETTESLSYNTERGNTLRAFMRKYKIDNSNYRDFFDVINGMDVNSEKGNVLKPLLATQKLDKRVLSDLIEVVDDDFSSNSEKAAIFRVLLPLVVGDEDLTSQFIMAVKDLAGSYHLLEEELLEWIAKGKVVTDKNLSKSAILNMLDIAGSYDANTRKSSTLRNLHGSMTNDKEVVEAYFDVIKSMDHNMEAYNLLLDLVRMHNLDEYGYKLLFEAAEEIADDDYGHGASAILRATIKDIPNDSAVLDAYFEALEEIDHDSGKEEIIRMFCERGKLDKRTVVYLLKTVEDIEVDIEKATSLMNIKKVMPQGDDELTYIFNSVADDIKSDYEYERAMN